MTKKSPLVLVLDNVRSAHNVGAVFRLADAFAVNHIYLCGITPTPPHRDIRKTALGAENTIPYTHTATVIDALIQLQKENYLLYCVEQTPQAQPLQSITQKDKNKPTALIFGHEVWGVSKEACQLAPQHLHIPQYGKKKSINVATCIAIVTWYWQQKNLNP